MVKNPEIMAGIFQALSAPTRIRLLCLLKSHSLSVSDIASQLGVTQGAVSQHLRTLRDVGLVRADRLGHEAHYRVLPSALDQCRQALECILERPEVLSRGRDRLTKGGRTRRASAVRAPRAWTMNASSDDAV